MAGEVMTPETVDVLEAAARDEGRPSQRLPPGRWIRKNLFNNWYNSLITVLLVALAAYLGYRAGRFMVVTGRWEPVRVNLELFMIGQFPRDERWRIVTQLILAGGAAGLGIGSMRMAARDRAEEAGEPWQPTPWRVYAYSYWAVALFLLVMLAFFTTTVGPWLVATGVVAAAVAGWLLAVALPRRLRSVGWTSAALLAVVQFQVVSGTYGLAWAFGTAALVPLVHHEVGVLLGDRSRHTATAFALAGAVVGIAVLLVRRDIFGVLALLLGAWGFFATQSGDRIDGARVGAVMVTGAVAFGVYQAIGLDGIDWEVWGGFHLNVIAAVIAIILAFPLGLLLALGRRSTLPAVRLLCIAYIEFFRGAPLITFLLSAQFFLGFFLNTDTPLSLMTRVIAALTLFTAAYIAEVVRGGLQAVPAGQVEAGQAMGLSPPKVMRLVVLPQALRAVIPAMVGQFISLFKDTSLLTIVSIPEYLGVREIVHGQSAFRGFGIAETLVFVAFGFWAVSFTMSRESQRLERRLGVGRR